MSSKDNVDFLPCPFCGAIPKFVTEDVEPQHDYWSGSKKESFVLCECGACMFDEKFHEGFGESPYARQMAVARWNERKV